MVGPIVILVGASQVRRSWGWLVGGWWRRRVSKVWPVGAAMLAVVFQVQARARRLMSVVAPSSEGVPIGWRAGSGQVGCWQEQEKSSGRGCVSERCGRSADGWAALPDG